MRRTPALISAALALAPGLLAQNPAPSAALTAAMKKLDWMAGTWKGEGWMSFGPQDKRPFLQLETVQPRLGGAVLVIEGLGKRRLEDGSAGPVTHQAFAVLSWDEKSGTHRFRSWLPDGRSLDVEAKVGERRWEWGYPDPRAGQVRYTLTLDEKGRWHEVGESSRDGQAWRPFLEMTLEKQP